MLLSLCFSGYVRLVMLLFFYSSGYVLRSELKVSGVLCCYVPLVIFLWLCASDNASLVLLLLLGSSGYMLHRLCSSGYVPLFLRPLLPQSFSLLVSSSLRRLVP